MSFPEPIELVPHRDEALLLESIDAVRPDGLVASLVLREALPGWSGPEVMAQAISAFATWRKGPPFRPKPGLLLGVRSYRSEVAEFERGSRLTVDVSESTRDDMGGAVFDSRIRLGDRNVADGMLTVFEPEDVMAALAEQLR
jgi:predicted hotdog family 3-hydroxylacyl-ACP dehydratase